VVFESNHDRCKYGVLKCARGDLETLAENSSLEHSEKGWPEKSAKQKRVPKPSGCYDTKVSSATETLKHGMRATIINGPTVEPGHTAPFEWKDWPNYPHKGLPPKYDFAPVVVAKKKKKP